MLRKICNEVDILFYKDRLFKILNNTLGGELHNIYQIIKYKYK